MVQRRPARRFLAALALVVVLAGSAHVARAQEPPKLDAELVKKLLPHCGEALLSGGDFRLLLVGDQTAVDASWPEAVAAALRQAAGNEKVALTVAARADRTAEDATIVMDRELLPAKPNLVLLALGAADALRGVSVESYLESLQWMAAQFAARSNADSLLVPIALPGAAEADAAAFAYWQALLGARRGYPVAKPTGSTLDESGRPSAPAMAAAVLAALSPPVPPATQLTATSHWSAERPALRLVLTNLTDQPRRGSLRVLPRQGESIDKTAPQAFDLGPKESAEQVFEWIGINSPVALLAPPYNRLLAGSRAVVTVEEITDTGRTLLSAGVAPRPEVLLVRNDGEVTSDLRLRVPIEAAGREQARSVNWPSESDVGRIGLLEPAYDESGQIGWGCAELYYVRFAGADRGDPTVDGSLSDWSRARWSPLSDPAQRRGSQLPAAPDAAVPAVEWAAQLGRHGLTVALRSAGADLPDQIQIGLDPRAMAQLGTVGPIYWVTVKLAPNGEATLTAGDTTPPGLALPPGRWHISRDGLAIELALPYALMEQTDWPEQDFIGATVLWTTGTAVYNWSGDTAWLSPREFGVLQRGGSHAKLPWLVRVR